MPSYSISPAYYGAVSNSRTLLRSSTGRLWAVYLKVASGYRQVFVAYSDDGGKTWTSEQVTSVSGNQCYIAAAIDQDDNLHVVWSGFGWSPNTSNFSVQWRKRTSSGWQSTESVANNIYDNIHPSVAVDSLGRVYVVWCCDEGGQYYIYYKTRTDSGWGYFSIVAYRSSEQRGPTCTVDLSGNLHVVWSGLGWGSNTSYFNIQYRKRLSSGSWESQEAVTDTNKHCNYLSVATLGSDVCVVWDAGDIYFRRRTTSWQPIETVTSKGSGQYGPTISTDVGGNLYVVWFGTGWGSNPTVVNIQMRKRTSSGWEDVVGITDSSNPQGYPSILWSSYPVDANVPVRGYTFVWMNNSVGTVLYIYLSNDLVWLEPVSGAATASSATSAELVRLKTITGSSESVAQTSGQFVGVSTVAGTACGAAVAQGAAATIWFLSSTAGGSATATGFVTRFINTLVSAVVAGIASTSGQLVRFVNSLVGVSTVHSSTSGVLFRFRAAIAAILHRTGSISGVRKDGMITGATRTGLVPGRVRE